MNLYLIYKVDTNDYSVSWTGNYSGCSCKIYGIFDSVEKLKQLQKVTGLNLSEMSSHLNHLKNGIVIVTM